MPNSICPANLVSGFDKPSQSSVENFVNCAWSRERILVSCTGDCLRGGLDSSQKPFYHGFPSPLTLRSQQMADPPRSPPVRSGRGRWPAALLVLARPLPLVGDLLPLRQLFRRE